MSYSIEYNRQFLKTSMGFIPVVLMGDNNVWECGNRRARSWTIPFKDLFNQTEERMLEVMREHANHYNQHWKRGSKYLSNSGLLSWVRSGCASACDLETFRIFNSLVGLEAALVLYDGHFNSVDILSEHPRTNEDLDAWCAKAKDYLQQEQPKSWFYRIRFSSEEFIHPPIGNGFFALKMSPRLFYSSSDSTHSNPKKALVLSAGDWLDRIKLDPIMAYGGTTPYFTKVVNASAFRRESGYVLKINGGDHAGMYVRSSVKHHCYLCSKSEDAHLYASLASARVAKENLGGKYQRIFGDLEIVSERG